MDTERNKNMKISLWGYREFYEMIFVNRDRDYLLAIYGYNDAMELMHFDMSVYDTQNTHSIDSNQNVL